MQVCGLFVDTMRNKNTIMQRVTYRLCKSAIIYIKFTVALLHKACERVMYVMCTAEPDQKSVIVVMRQY